MGKGSECFIGDRFMEFSIKDKLTFFKHNLKVISHNLKPKENLDDL